MPEYKELEKLRSLASEIGEHMASDERKLIDALVKTVEEAYECAERGDLDCVMTKHFSAGMRLAAVIPKISLWYIQDLAIAVGAALGEASKVLKEKIGKGGTAQSGSHGSSSGILGALAPLVAIIAVASIPIALSLLMTFSHGRPI